MKQIKLINAYSMLRLEQLTNRFIENKNILFIDHNLNIVKEDNSATLYSVMVVYEVKK